MLDPADPGPITINDVTPTSIRFCWQAATFGQYDDYTIFVIPPSGEIVSNLNFIIPATDEANPCQLVDGLNPSTSYQIQVQTMLRRENNFGSQQGDTTQTVMQTTGKKQISIQLKTGSSELFIK